MNKIFIFIFLVIFYPFSCFGGDIKIITAAADPWPPFVDINSPNQGFSLEVIRAAFKTQGYDVKMEFVPWARAEYDVKYGSYDILPDTWMTDSRKKDFQFSKPYATNNIRFIAMKDDAFEYKNINSLKGKKIGTIRGYGYSDDFLKSDQFTREETHDLIQNIKKMTAQRLDLVIEDEIVARVRIAKEEPNLFKQIRFCKTPFSSKGLYVVSGLKNPRHNEIIEAFNNGLDKIKKDGTLVKIYENYNLHYTQKD